jgi:hypothetical protein
MPRTRATRTGNGSGGTGWGGAAKGAGKPPGNKLGGRPPGVRPGEGKRTVADLMIEAGARELAAQRWLEILTDPAHPRHAEMVAKAADRMDGAPTQPVSGEGAFVINVMKRADD